MLLSVDYGVDRDSILGMAIAKAGIDAAHLPIKSSMWVDPKLLQIEYSFGYGAEWKFAKI